jgi:eukaryotic-like serine/threonine-protein kinase
VPGYHADLALSRNNYGNLLKTLGKRDEAEAEFRAAVALQEKLAADHPGVPQYRQELATSHHNLGVLLAGAGRRSEAEAEYRTALAVREKLAADHPDVPQYRLELVPSYNTLALLLRDGGDPQAALGWLDRAVETLNPLVAQAPRAVTQRQYLRNTLQGRARTLEQLGRYATALADWDQALALADSSVPPAWRLARAVCLARAGQPDRAVTEAEELSRQPGAAADLLYDCACAVALAAAAGGDAAVADSRAARAVELLRQAVAQGYKDVAHMAKDPDLAALRGRADFRELLKGLTPPPAPPAGRPGAGGP